MNFTMREGQQHFSTLTLWRHWLGSFDQGALHLETADQCCLWCLLWPCWHTWSLLTFLLSKLDSMTPAGEVNQPLNLKFETLRTRYLDDTWYTFNFKLFFHVCSISVFNWNPSANLWFRWPGLSHLHNSTPKASVAWFELWQKWWFWFKIDYVCMMSMYVLFVWSFFMTSWFMDLEWNSLSLSITFTRTFCDAFARCQCRCFTVTSNAPTFYWYRSQLHKWTICCFTYFIVWGRMSLNSFAVRDRKYAFFLMCWHPCLVVPPCMEKAGMTTIWLLRTAMGQQKWLILQLPQDLLQDVASNRQSQC